MIDSSMPVEVPEEVLSNPSLLFLYYRVEQILGIRAGSSALIKLNDYIEKTCGSSFIENPADYERLLASREHIFEISKLVTINETYFFREGVHFSLLITLLPQLIKLNRTIQICSAATSTGCEAYSIAMLLDNYIKDNSYFDFEIDAFDVSAEAIETAQKGRYTENALRSDGSSWKYVFDSYIIKENNEYIVMQNIRKKVRFFPHNIMRGLDKKYDVIFFRNALIYFTHRNRLDVINNLTKSLYDGGFLFLGISETSAVQHPLLVSRYSALTELTQSASGESSLSAPGGSGDAFYFQKTANAADMEYHDSGFRIPGRAEIHELKQNILQVSPDNASRDGNEKKIIADNKQTRNAVSVSLKQKELPVSIAEIISILESEEGSINAKKTLDIFADNNAESLSGGELAASVLFFLNMQNYNSAAIVLSYLESRNAGAFTRFLQGEYNYLKGNAREAEQYFQEASIKDKKFWPAFYRIAMLAADGNRTRYEYKMKKAIESLELSENTEFSQDNKEMRYECFLGGFSPDYFRRVLEKKLS